LKRLSQLDGIRGLAIALVLGCHFIPMLQDGLGKNRIADTLYRIFITGWFGVDIFFVLSGFLITGIILKERQDPDFWSNFYLRRAFRILPAFIVIFGITLVAVHFLMPSVLISPVYVWMATLFLANWTVLTPFQLPILLHVWSLAVEEQFYFLWPQAAKRLTTVQVFQLALGMAVASNLLRIGLAAHVNPYTLYESTPTRIDGISIGAALAAGVMLPRVRQFLSQWWRRIALAAVAAFVLTLVLVHGRLNGFDAKSQIFAIPPVVILAAMLIFGVLENALPRLLARFFGSPAMTYLGRRSYALYLLHEPVRVAFSSSRTGGVLARLPGGVAVNCILMFAALAVSVLLTEASWRLVESPAQNMRKRLMRGQEASPQTGSAEEAEIAALARQSRVGTPIL